MSQPVTSAQIEALLVALAEMRNAYLVQSSSQGEAYPFRCYFEAQTGPRYTRIVVRETHNGQKIELSGSAFCFIENATGAILKADGWKKPAKQPRGNINSPAGGLEYLGPYGPAYLKRRAA